MASLITISIRRKRCIQTCKQVSGIDSTLNALHGRSRVTPCGGSFARRGPARNPRLDLAPIGIVCAFLDNIQHLLQNGRAVALDVHVGGKSPHRKIGLQRIDIDLDPAPGRRCLQRLRHERHIDVEQQPEIRRWHDRGWIETGKARRVLRIFRSIELNSTTRMPHVLASRSSTATACGLRPR